MHILPGTETKAQNTSQRPQARSPARGRSKPAHIRPRRQRHPNKRRLPPRPSHIPHPTSNILVHMHPFTGQAGQPYVATVAVTATAFCRQMGGYDIPPGRVGG